MIRKGHLQSIIFHQNGDPPYNGCGLIPKRSTILRFILLSSSFVYVKNPKLVTNYPPVGTPFTRDEWYEVETDCEKNGQFDWYTDIHVELAGTFDYYLTWNDNGVQKKGKVGHFVVNPILQLGKDNILSVGCLSIQTVITKCLGDFSRWGDYFQQSAAAGYNMIHFTPIQQLGESGSSYSLYHQHIISPTIFPNRENLTEEEKFSAILQLFQMANTEFGVLTLGELVLNHTANNSPWLKEHPEATYNIETTPYLKPALELDLELAKLSENLMTGKYVSKYNITNITNEQELEIVRKILSEEIFPSLRLWEYFVINVDKAVGDLNTALLMKKPASKHYTVSLNDEMAVQNLLRTEGLVIHEKRNRFCHTMDSEVALGLFGNGYYNQGMSLEQTCANYRRHLDLFNLPRYRELQDDLDCAINAIISSIRHEILNPGKKLSKKTPLVPPYFHPIINPQGEKFYAASNGWIFGSTPTEDFAGPNSKSYLRREIVIWTDTVKLRYGNGPEDRDSRWLWEHMKTYTELMAHLFNGLRLDNCHSTPLHVARYLIDAARAIRPEIYIVAELFTGSTDLDRLYISTLGINSLIREAMNAPDATEMSRICYLYGGNPVGSVLSYYPPRYYDNQNSQVTIERDLPTLNIGEPPALFFDCTHDNDVPAEKRHPRDSLPNSALVSMIACPIGSVKGYDYLVPRRIDVVSENRLYPKGVTEGEPSGMTTARKIFNDLHSHLELHGYSEQHTHQDGDMIIIQRHHPDNNKAFYSASRTSYARDGSSVNRNITVKVPGKISRFLGYYYLEVSNDVAKKPASPNFIQGLHTKLIEISGDDEKALGQIFSVAVCQNGVDQYVELRFKHFPPGSVLLFEVEMPDDSVLAVAELAEIDEDYSIYNSFENLDSTAFSYLFYSCENEELGLTEGKRGCYQIPNFGKFPYAGIAGIASVLNTIRKTTDMGHPLFDNLRAGNWLMDYILDRLDISRKYRAIKAWLNRYFDLIKRLPRYYIPKYFDKVLMKYYLCGRQYMITKLMGTFVSNNTDNFIQQIALTSFQFINSSSYLIDPGLAQFGNKPLKATIAAGLPHFSTGFMRVWGRDTFISLRGLLLVTGRWQEARELIIGFASALRHGLIPNLLDSGRNPRYNSRDASWWFLQALQDYTKMAPEGVKILQEMVPCLFPWDTYQNSGVLSTHRKQLTAIVQEIMQQHAKTIDYRERNAGTSIDDKMQPEGFNVRIWCDPKTGFIFGGNDRNCGTWMDKMGESHRAGNHGIPATPRDGADIEIIGLLKSTTRWLSQLSKNKIFPYAGVKVHINPHNPAEECMVSYKEWDQWIQDNFERNFYIPLNPEDDRKYVINTKLVNRRGIYKDVVGTKCEWADYQLRPNMCIAMCVAPELFSKEHARHAIDIVEKVLVGPLGMKTLDPSDWNYKPNYDNATDSDEYKTSRGFNYHQGPEWVWCFGYFLKAKILFHFPPQTEPIKIRNSIQQLIQHHRQHIKEDKWQGLPELTNENGKECTFGCPTQAWSSATLLEALYDMYALVKWEDEIRDQSEV